LIIAVACAFKVPSRCDCICGEDHKGIHMILQQPQKNQPLNALLSHMLGGGGGRSEEAGLWPRVLPRLHDRLVWREIRKWHARHLPHLQKGRRASSTDSFPTSPKVHEATAVWRQTHDLHCQPAAGVVQPIYDRPLQSQRNIERNTLGVVRLYRCDVIDASGYMTRRSFCKRGRHQPPFKAAARRRGASSSSFPSVPSAPCHERHAFGLRSPFNWSPAASSPHAHRPPHATSL
jgi:hypothetical protein